MSDIPTVPADNVAAPGPHPHESADFRDWHGCDSVGAPTPAEVPAVPTDQGSGVV